MSLHYRWNVTNNRVPKKLTETHVQNVILCYLSNISEFESIDT